MKEFETLYNAVIQWHYDRNLIDGSDDRSQMMKLFEEYTELLEGVIKGDNLSIVDAIGDMMVVLSNIAERHGYTLSECLQYAYDSIKDRTGRIINGVFLKDEK